MDIATLTASLAGICMAICQIPQAWLVYKTKDTRGISLLMQCVLTAGITFWFVTGLLISNIPMWLSNGVCLIFCLYVLAMCLRQRKKKT